MPVKVIQVTTTVAERADAERISTSLVAKHLAACVQILGPIESTYRWKGQVEVSQEWICLIKTRRDLYGTVEQAIRELHSYEQPEIIAVEIVEGSQGYLSWVADAVRPDGQFNE
jgi:periplasmic divalent cation tolerance protein